MIGLVIAAHGDVAASLLRAAESIVGPLTQAVALSIDATRDLSTHRDAFREAYARIDSGAGVLVLCDMFGGSPANVCTTAGGRGAVEVVTGVNLPMVLKVASLRETQPLEELAAQITTYGQKNIAHASRLLREREAALAVRAPHPPVGIGAR